MEVDTNRAQQANPPADGSVKTVNYEVVKIPDPNPISDTLTPSVNVASITADKELLRIRSFPFLDLFPNEMIIREKSIHVIQREFLRSQIETMLIQDISIVTVMQGLFFASLSVSYRIPHDDFVITNVPKSAATQAKAILDSLIITKQSQGETVEVLSSGVPVISDPTTAVSNQ